MKTTSYIIFSIVGIYLAFTGFFMLYGMVIPTLYDHPYSRINLTDNPVQTLVDADIHTIKLLSTDGENPESGMLFAYMSPFPGVWITCDDSAAYTTVEYAEGWGDNIKTTCTDGILTLEISTQFPRDKYYNSITNDPLPLKITGARNLTNIDNELPFWGTPSIMHVTADTFNIRCKAGNYFRYCNIGNVNIEPYPGTSGSESLLTFKYDTDIKNLIISGTFSEELRLLSDSSSVVRQMVWNQPEGCTDININIEGTNIEKLMINREK